MCLNGQSLLPPADFSQQASGHVLEVLLADPSTLEVWTASKPGSELTIWIDGVPDAGNSPPVADAGADQTPLVGKTVQLDGSGSADVDGDVLT